MTGKPLWTDSSSVEATTDHKQESPLLREFNKKFKKHIFKNIHRSNESQSPKQDRSSKRMSRIILKKSEVPKPRYTMVSARA